MEDPDPEPDPDPDPYKKLGKSESDTQVTENIPHLNFLCF
jgi:hypothetical protein